MAPTTLRARLVPLLAATALLAGLALGAGLLLSSDDDPSVGPLDVSFLGFAQPASVGGTFYVNTGDAKNTGDEPVRLLDARLVDASPGVVLRGLRRNPVSADGQRFDLAGGRTLLADAQRRGFPGRFPDAAGTTLGPGEDTWLVLLLRAPRRAGLVRIPALEIRYATGDDEWLARVDVGHTVCVGATGPDCG
jgi:hypothetical protein